MTIRELQLETVGILNGVEELVQGRCKAFAEDARSTYDEANQWTAGGKVAIVVVTPRMERSGDAAEGIPADTRLLLRCIEKAPISKNNGAIRALDAAELAMHALDGHRFCWLETDQTADRQTGTVTATATFATTITM